jgi:PAS domain-containing protein
METTVDERKKTKTQLIGELAVLRQQIEQMVCSGFLESLLYVQKDRDRRKDGSTCFVDVAGNVINDLDDSPARTLAVIQDITESKRTEEALSLSEEKFAKAFAGNPAAIVMTRLEDGLFLEVNDT